MDPEVTTIVAKHINHQCKRGSASKYCNLQRYQTGDNAVKHVEDYDKTHRRWAHEIERDKDDSACPEHEHGLGDSSKLILSPSTVFKKLLETRSRFFFILPWTLHKQIEIKDSRHDVCDQSDRRRDAGLPVKLELDLCNLCARNLLTFQLSEWEKILAKFLAQSNTLIAR